MADWKHQIDCLCYLDAGMAVVFGQLQRYCPPPESGIGSVFNTGRFCDTAVTNRRPLTQNWEAQATCLDKLADTGKLACWGQSNG